MLAARSNIRLQTLVLLAGIGLMGIKFLAWRLTHSNTILSDALESIVNVVAGAFALYSLMLAAKPRDREHPYGHGKVEFISAGIEGGLVVIAGGVIIWRAVEALRAGQHLHDLDTGIALTGAAGALNLLMGLTLKRRGVKAHSITMEASGTHLLSDAWSTVAMVAGLVLIRLTGLLWLDQAFAIVFAVYIIVTGLRVFRRSVAGIMDEADLDLGGKVIAVLQENRKPGWVDIHNFRMIKYGSILHVDCHATLPWYYTLEQAHKEISAMEQLVNERMGRTVELFIHMDPCVPASCSICDLADCSQRQQRFVKEVPWSIETVLSNRKHAVE
ncbi:MAG: cation transporter [Flavobacteriales bacterium]|jgi:cation diffusion facilitator family transporter|nr:cation transporter [Flavobacteriales bacterium]MBK7269649.1 cation transporter [Flavobacteriales bacterium]MBK9074665.1 cation transporter [Flavobacteriales bacterium]